MRLWGAVAAVLLVTACSEGDWAPPAQAYRHLGDRLKVYFPFLGVPCGIGGVGVGEEQRADQCYRFGTPRRMSGVLVTNGSWSIFHEGETQMREKDLFHFGLDVVSDRYQLILPKRKVKLKSGTVMATSDSWKKPRAYHVTFVGRETARFPSYPTGSFATIDRIEAIRRLPLLPD
ncbi:hypothetical protein LZK98_12100 [Sphingomonas cannabina]|uniref:hypothetical protein n=1 Tax=Sphingomonas cannabina TaxID=2899123 RepID=UPI001F25AD5B|nr:hypothetical protein [Sphingomonas cannabina]UIJ43834.1 hypothetical protein LZK98_12100 [Sphingomonas cannabina]